MKQEHGQDFRGQPLALPGTGKIRRLGQRDDPEIFADPDDLPFLLQLLIGESGDALHFVVSVAPEKPGSVEKLQISIVDEAVKDGQGAAVDLVDPVQNCHPAFHGSFHEG